MASPALSSVVPVASSAPRPPLMRTATAAALLGLAALAAADNSATAILTGAHSSDVSSQTWEQVMDSPTNSSSAKFTGFNLTQGYPGTQQQGWQLKIGVKTGLPSNLTATAMSIAPAAGQELGKVDDSWHLCVHTFSVKASSAGNWGSGKNDSCSGLVAVECIQNLVKDAASNYATDSCPDYSTKPACLRDLEQQTSLSLSLSAKNIPSAIGHNSTFFRRADGTDAKAFTTAAGQPMAVLTVWGPSGNAEKAPTVEVACVMPNAKVAAVSASTRAVAFLGWSAVTLAVAFQLVL
ncbi:hypothetical protein TOPH_07850 [Tolypocladium ophioglossoides CBS 100239]|uniref:Uncharacterized protein n=1 Tax=Tolypocladium ophioglossoides (strain CBS 100239) TaxID=1163406 RepID=A0A0L0N0M3_TOLOC|nr:hypothetical protein TOPH_07850 [Tolypocladium ophioglossoides CBS 100239]